MSRAPLAIRQESERVPCPVCYAAVGVRCVTVNGFQTEWPHSARLDVARGVNPGDLIAIRYGHRTP